MEAALKVVGSSMAGWPLPPLFGPVARGRKGAEPVGFWLATLGAQKTAWRRMLRGILGRELG